MNIQQTIEQYYQLPEGSIQVKTRKREIVIARQICHKLACEMNKNKSLALIGKEYGGKKHETVMHSIKTIDNLIETDKSIRNDYKEIMLLISSSITEAERNNAIIQGLVKCVLKHKNPT